MKKLLPILIILILLSACAHIQVEPKRYYILEYKKVKENQELIQKTPFNNTVRVIDAELSRTYDRKQIVLRTSENMIEFNYDHLWADHLSESLSNLIQTRINRYRIFNQVYRDMQQSVDFEIVPVVQSIEFLDYGVKNGAHLNMDIYLKNIKDNKYIIQHHVESTVLMYDRDFEMFVQTINDMVMEETDKFIIKTVKYLKNPSKAIQVDSLTGDFAVEKTEEDSSYVQDLSDVDLSSLGRVVIGSMSDPDYEPPFSIEDLSGNDLGSYKMGSDVLLEPGKYIVVIGNGSANQKIKKEIEVFPRYKLYVKPEWGWLTVDVIDQNRSQVDQRYELFDLVTGESYGFGYGILEGVGQKLESWVLKPGYYKIVLQGYPFNTYTDFATVEVKPEKSEHITIVFDTENKKMLGAGKILQDDLLNAKNHLNVSILNHLNANIQSNNDTSKSKYLTTVVLSEQLDSKMVYDVFPHYYSLKNITELGITKDTDTEIRFSSDKFDLKNTYVYFFYNWIGVYSRADVNTHFFNEFIHTSDSQWYKKLDLDENGKLSYTKKFQIKSSLTPLTFKEGAGINLRLLNTSRANLNIRSGLGLLQNINKEYYIYDSTLEDSIIVYKELESKYQKGTEVSLNGNFQIFSNLTYSTNADLLFPFDKKLSSTINWENAFNLRLLNAVSLDYRINLDYDKDKKNYVQMDHSLFLRFTYIFTQ